MAKFFDIHIEVGPVNMGMFYARTILGNGGAKIEHQGPNVMAAVTQVLADMDNMGLWNMMANDPTVSQFPFNYGGAPPTGSGGGPTTNVNKRKKKDPPKKLPSELTTVDKPACQALCTSFEHFKDKKCGSICASKK